MLQVSVNEKNNYAITNNDGQWVINDNNADPDISMQPNGLISVLLNGKSYTAIIEKTDRKNKEVTIRVNGQQYTTAIKEPIDQLLTNMGMDLKSMQKAEPVKAPMPGMILKVLVEPGQVVSKGDGLIILEAMKMENMLKAAAPGTVKSIKAVERTAVEKGAVLIEME
ncbi:acetyl-CoA carboxylase biotin carboxyl carrier protein subunit [Flavipsychrobacter stenotrophus]|uniref:Acetyl-CoA carboxylase biotin carboxyl carrier protein subunit n=1 Tax=Flavipsychrobacter stenotrophus TaxID=2077091 RepID=A0A2S7SZ57_9BACT|nr:acetyl-CoA carboxylase biotin carboxyl carrier protein subunit [Flavipsychrobacter stenotrophus]PQJ12229.1 acetyl-CoA carboxylase biotin carboxyl carrier protein subunit [Flavipsychrobacter stenotrophus]